MKHIRTAAGVALALGLVGCGAGQEAGPPEGRPATSTSASPSDAPVGVVVDEGLPVWWDSDGLHRGDMVEQTPVRLEEGFRGHLALVRSGALYRAAGTGEIWFHPWGGAPRVVGHGTDAGPGGDPQGDVAVWFDGRKLVVYDTARSEVISRSREQAAVSPQAEYVEHLGHSNGWVHVSSTQVVWRYDTDDPEEVDEFARRDLVTHTTELPWRPRPSSPAKSAARFVDVSGTSAVWVVGDNYEGAGTFLYDRQGSAQTRRVRDLEGFGRLSPDGSWLVTAELADGTHGVAITDLRSGEVWKPFAKPTYAFFSWAYGDVVVMRTDVGDPDGPWTLTSCAASTRTCETLPTRGEVVLPNP